ncbi:phosphotransferase [Thalassobaculum sp.]|uniref:phosphotransferase n=1 Tax=Thalassobaculum sp. TaxID=2022740 RepID=UPI0032EF67BE
MRDQVTDPAGIGRLLDGLDLGIRNLVFVAKASTCEVWRADTAAGPVAVRVLAPHPGKTTEIDADVALRRQLLAAGDALVARPLADHRMRPGLAAAPHRPAWVIDHWIEGERTVAGSGDAVWHELGRLLAKLHAIPVAGHGRLRIDGNGLAGRRGDMAAGILDRFDDPWPFSGQPLAGHPLADAAPAAGAIASRLERLELAIRAASDAQPVIVHGDLNGANIRQADGRLCGLIDFADASVLAPAWDFALLRHFLGPRAVDRTLAGYTTDRARADRLAGDARLLALVVALHHLSRARTLGLPERRATALDRLHTGLDEIEAG